MDKKERAWLPPPLSHPYTTGSYLTVADTGMVEGVGSQDVEQGGHVMIPLPRKRLQSKYI